MTFLANIADRVINRPLLIMPEKAAVIFNVLSGRLGMSEIGASRFVGDGKERDYYGRLVGKPYKHQDGVGILSIVGSLINRGAYIDANSGLVSYEGLQHQLKALAADDDLHSVILDIQSPGGEAVGCFETAAAVRELAKSKRVVAVVNGMAASAAYAIASAADEIVTIETGISGSIGVVLLHADYSRQLANEGITPTFIFAGEHKVDGNPFEPLPESVRADLQGEIDAFYLKFLETVALGRGSRMSVEQARSTQARTFIGQAAVDAGLADSVGTFESVLADLTRGASRNPSQKGITMSEKTGASAAETDAGITKADLDKAVADARTAGVEEGKAAAAEGNKADIDAALKADRDRVAAILEISEPGAEAIVNKGIASGASAGDVALEIAKSPEVKAKRKSADTLAALAGDDASAAGAKPAAADADLEAEADDEDGWRAAYAKSADLKAEFFTADHYVAHKKREAKKKGQSK